MATFFENREIVVPGQLLAEGRYRSSFGTYVSADDEVFSALVGLAELRGNTVRVVPLHGVYIPREGDRVIGTITFVAGNNWKVDIGGPYGASLHANNALRKPYDDDISKYYDVGDVIAAEVATYDRTTGPYLSMKGRGLRKLKGGTIVEVSPAKIPRVIGRKGSMINMIKDKLDIQAMVGQNGRIWIRGGDLDSLQIAKKAFKMVAEQSHTKNLTDRVAQMIDEELAKLHENDENEETEETSALEDGEEVEDEEEMEEVNEE
ncbi:MAG: KH domain-containing protein [Candidatus Thorarchaeota archaeon]|nr:KH domain-containing protein [Candidatus Thorarchaeota archaeon]